MPAQGENTPNDVPAEELELSTWNAAGVTSGPTTTVSTPTNSIVELQNISQLPPVDRGRAALGFVFGGILVEGLGWGKS